MHCPTCSASIPSESRFCPNCGTAIACRACGFAIAPGARFCGGCGKPLAPATASPAPLPATPAPTGDSAAERRQITVMFCDLVDSTAMSARLDPEDHHEIIRSYQATCAGIIAEFEGHVAQYLGDGIMVYFGYPRAHEDDPERAIHAGLRITRAVAALRPRHDLRLSTRVGIATGLVVVGDRITAGTGWEFGVVGETPNLAARIQGLAQPNTVVIGPTTRRLLGNQFEYQDLGSHNLKGFDQPVQAWRVLAERSIASRFKAVRSSAMVPLVDRVEERAMLKERTARVLNGEGQVVMLGGEPGIGKSRLARAAAESLCEEHGAWLMEIQCSSFHTQSALFPLIASLRQFVFPEGMPKDPGDGWARLRAFLETAGFQEGDDALLLFANLLSIPAPADYPLLTLVPERQKQLTLHYLLRLIQRCAGNKPVLLLLEDLHWADPSTLEFIDLVVEHSWSRPMFGLFTFRPGFNPPVWVDHPHVTVATLGRLPNKDAVELVRHMSGLEPLAPEVVETVIAKTDGIPLYLQEYTKTMVESRQSDKGAGRASSAVIPSTLHDLLLARLDRLGEAKLVSQIAAMLGREFKVALLEAVWNGNPDLLWTGINRLIDEEVVHSPEEPVRDRLVFRHALIQDAAYESLLKSSRTQIHRRIAEVIERDFPDTAASEPEVLAHHFTAAGLNSKAIHYWEQAGLRAAKLVAYAEASRHIGAALELVATLPEDSARHALELRLQGQLGMSLGAARGYALPDVQTAYQRARELCTLLGDTADLYPVFRGLVSFWIVRGELKTALELSDSCLRLAQETQRPDYLIEAYNSMGYSLAYMGFLKPGAEMLAEGVRVYCASDGERLNFPSPHDPRMGCTSLLSVVLWMLGDAQRATQYHQDLLEFLERRKRPFDLAYGHFYSSLFEAFRGRYESAARYAAYSRDVAIQNGYQFWSHGNTMLYAAAKGRMGEADDTVIEMLKSGLEGWRASGGEMFLTYGFAVLAETYRAAGRIGEALSSIGEGIEQADRCHEYLFRSILYRIRGELRSLSGDDAGASSDLQKALELAREQEALLLELKAALSLYRLPRDRALREPARATLAHAVEKLAARGYPDILELHEAEGLLAETRALPDSTAQHGMPRAAASLEPPALGN
jgi:class 3 adenylate cyclase/tetratricopeptide (TPR) repeat protein